MGVPYQLPFLIALYPLVAPCAHRIVVVYIMTILVLESWRISLISTPDSNDMFLMSMYRISY